MSREPDIVEWLRDIAEKTIEGPRLREAADTIERLTAAWENEVIVTRELRAEVARLTAALDIESAMVAFHQKNEQIKNDKVRDLYAEIERLKAHQRNAPILSKYHGQRGFEVERFIADYTAWAALERKP